MNHQQSATISSRRRLHPMIIIAACAVTVFSLTGVAAIMGWLPTSRSGEAASTAAASTETAPVAKLDAAKAAGAMEPAPQPELTPRPQPVQRAVPPRPASPPPVAARGEAPAAVPPAPRAVCRDCGTVLAVRALTQKGEGSGLGAVAGGIGGAVLGHQVGNGRGQDVGTVVGAVGGAFAGHEIEKRVRTTTVYEIDVRFEDGSAKTFRQQAAPTLRAGDRVRLMNGALQASG